MKKLIILFLLLQSSFSFGQGYNEWVPGNLKINEVIRLSPVLADSTFTFYNVTTQKPIMGTDAFGSFFVATRLHVLFPGVADGVIFDQGLNDNEVGMYSESNLGEMATWDAAQEQYQYCDGKLLYKAGANELRFGYNATTDSGLVRKGQLKTMSFADSVAFHGNVNITTLGTVGTGSWDATVIDTAKTNAVGKITTKAGSGITATKTGKSSYNISTGYIEYTVLLTQSTTDPPDPVPLGDTTTFSTAVGGVVYTYSALGKYILKRGDEGTWDVTKTSVEIGSANLDGGGFDADHALAIAFIDNGTAANLNIETFRISDNSSRDEKLNNTLLRIRIYD